MEVSILNRIKEFRKAKGLTQAQLAEKSKISRTTVAELESGERENATIGTLKSIASALDTSVESLFF